MFRGSRYELWSRLLNESGREIPWEVSWPAYTFNREPSPSGSGAAAGANSFNTDLWWHSAAVGHEFRFYNDNTANWLHILDIAAWTHEADLARFHRPGAYAFMDMLESGIGSLTFAESRAHFGLWVLMAQPLHLGMDLRNASAGLMGVFANEEVIRLGADDTLAKMGWRASMSDWLSCVTCLSCFRAVESSCFRRSFSSTEPCSWCSIVSTSICKQARKNTVR